MPKGLFVVAASLVLMVLSGREASAAAFCAYGGGARGGGYENCGFHTWEQCLANISGMGGSCMRNPHDPSLWGYPAARAYPSRRR